ncbi:MAG: terminase gpP N-terminus-related DNA-binding protein, partial [Enterovibrio sp.]
MNENIETESTNQRQVAKNLFWQGWHVREISKSLQLPE